MCLAQDTRCGGLAPAAVPVSSQYQQRGQIQFDTHGNRWKCASAAGHSSTLHLLIINSRAGERRAYDLLL